MTQITPGTSLRSYEILSLLGEGGMGQVWRARDSNIGRQVAIKVLPASFTSNSDRLRRFELEAKTAGSLNHPNLVTIYELGTQDGAPFIVMELLEGETLREKLGDGPAAHALPHRKAIDYATQMATGLAAAHEKGVVHRDLKPENIFITKDGRLKILDFGLAKLRDVEVGPEDQTNQLGTAPGTVMGTPGYMSPEQVRGEVVDHGSDIFSFGAIVYEMLSGKRAFQRRSSVETMNSILHEEPPELGSSPEHAPPALERIIRRCLEKESGQRFRSARDLAFAFDAVGGSSITAPVPIAVQVQESKGRRRWAAALIAVAVGVGLGALGTTIAHRSSLGGAPAPLLSFSQLTFEAGLESEPSLSPDGKTFAFVREVDGQTDVFVQRVGGQSATNITRGNPKNDSQPAFSPDGSLIAFCSGSDLDGGIFVVGATGESIRRLTETGFNPTWSPDGTEIAYASEGVINPRSRAGISTLSVVTVAGGATRLLFEGDAIQPRWSPDGRRIAFWGTDSLGNREIQTVSATPAKTEKAVAVTNDPAVDWNPVWSPDGRNIYFLSDRDGTMNVWRVGIDPGTGVSAEDPQPVRVPATDVAFLSAPSNDGRLIYQSTTSRGEMFHASIDGDRGTVQVGARPLFAGSLLVRSTSMSPDGSWIAFTSEGRQEDVYVMRADGTDIRQLTNDAARDRAVSWWPDGSRIVFYSNRVDTYDCWSIRPDGSGLTRLTTSPTDGRRGAQFPRVSPDGRRLAYFRFGGGSVGTLGARGVEGPEDALPPLPEAAGSFWPSSWSPDGQRLLGTKWASSRGGLYVYRLGTGTYDLVDPGASDGGWIDGSRVFSIDPRGGVRIINLSTKDARSVGRIDGLELEDSNTDLTSGARGIVFARWTKEADIWLMSTKSESEKPRR